MRQLHKGLYSTFGNPFRSSLIYAFVNHRKTAFSLRRRVATRDSVHGNGRRNYRLLAESIRWYSRTLLTFHDRRSTLGRGGGVVLVAKRSFDEIELGVDDSLREAIVRAVPAGKPEGERELDR